LSRSEVAEATAAGATDRTFYRIGGIAAIIVLAVALLEMVITFLPGGSVTPTGITEWFTLLQDNWFLGIRNLGLLNIFITAFGIPAYLALYVAHRNRAGAYAALTVIVAFTGAAVFLATNRAFPMLALSNQRATATGAERPIIEAAGLALLSVGQSHTAGTFLAFFLSEVAGLSISVIMLKGGVFGRPVAYVGIVGFTVLLAFEVVASFVPALFSAFLMVAALGGMLSMVWYALTARTLLRLASA